MSPKIEEDVYNKGFKAGQRLPRTLVIIEEAHEFLSRERIGKMPNLFQQVDRIAKRGANAGWGWSS